jgi:hypothetical protein
MVVLTLPLLEIIFSLKRSLVGSSVSRHTREVCKANFICFYLLNRFNSFSGGCPLPISAENRVLIKSTLRPQPCVPLLDPTPAKSPKLLISPRYPSRVELVVLKTGAVHGLLRNVRRVDAFGLGGHGRGKEGFAFVFFSDLVH